MLDTQADAQAAATETLTATVHQHVDTAPPLVSGREVTFRLASTLSDRFAPLLRALDQYKLTEEEAKAGGGVEYTVNWSHCCFHS